MRVRNPTRRITLDALRRYAVARTLFKPTTLRRAIAKLGFVQADPIRAPARAQDLTLRHRVVDYRAGDLERRYGRLGIEEDFFVNYGFLPRASHALMHPRNPVGNAWSEDRARLAAAVSEFIRLNGAVHPRMVDAHFARGKVLNWFGGSTNATTELLDDMHYRGLLRVARRDGGTRVYALRESNAAAAEAGIGAARFDALVDIVMQKYAPLPAASLGHLLRLLVRGVPQWSEYRAAALDRARRRFAHARVEGIDWYWPPAESPLSSRWNPVPRVRLLTPFDPVVWDRRRFAAIWGWTYRFEAYTPRAKRTLGYYALPLLWHDRVIGWGNVAATTGVLDASFGWVSGSPPREAGFRRELAAELARLDAFLQASQTVSNSSRKPPIAKPRSTK